MLKRIVFFCIFASFWASSVFARGIGIGSDTGELLPQKLPAPAESSKQSALGLYIAALLENSNMEKKAELLLKAAELEPENRLLVLVLVKTVDKVPGKMKAVQRFLEQAHQRFPHNIFLAQQSCQMDAKLQVSPEKIIRKAYPVLKNTVPKTADQRYFYQLATQYLDLLLITASPTQVLPFQTDQMELLELGIWYYTSSRNKDLLLARDPALAQIQLDIQIKRLEQYPFDEIAKVRRAAAVAWAFKNYDLAFRIVRSWHEKNASLESTSLLIETAARAGEEKTLDLLLKKYSALAVDFCVRMRCIALRHNGKYEQAVQMSENFQNPAERIQQLQWIALRRRDVKLLERIVVMQQKMLRKDPRNMVNLLLSLAEMSRNLRYFEQAEKIVQDSIEKDHTLANAFGYVAAVLGHNLDQAKKRIAFALRSYRGNPAYLDSMAWVCFKQGNFAEAEKYLVQALGKADVSMSMAVLADHAGDIYFALKQNAKALYYYQTALHLYQEYPQINTELDLNALKQKIKKRFPEKSK